ALRVPAVAAHRLDAGEHARALQRVQEVALHPAHLGHVLARAGIARDRELAAQPLQAAQHRDLAPRVLLAQDVAADGETADRPGRHRPVRLVAVRLAAVAPAGGTADRRPRAARDQRLPVLVLRVLVEHRLPPPVARATEDLLGEGDAGV